MQEPIKNFPRIIQIENPEDAAFEISLIGSDSRSIDIMKDKSIFFNIKLKDLSSPQANIIKQEMLSLGAEAATSHGTINCKADKTDVLLSGTLSQYKKLAKKLMLHPFKLPQMAEGIKTAISNFTHYPAPLKLSNKILDFKKRAYIMGILNVTPDSFSDGGKYFDVSSAISRAYELIEEGADIIDIGGESTRPGATPISEEEEIRRVLPVVKALAKQKKCIISVDTQKSSVADKVLKAGADIINDISALRFDKNMAKTVAKHKAALILMHMQGTPENMQKKPKYKDIVEEILIFLSKSVEIARKAGILSTRIIVDPGFGFGKDLNHNFVLLKRLQEFKALGQPLLVGTSRKAMIGKVLNGLPTEKRLFGTAATIAVAILNGANIIRVHDVAEMKQVMKICDTVKRVNSHTKD